MLEATIIVVALLFVGIVALSSDDEFTCRVGFVTFWFAFASCFLVLGLSVANAQSVQTTVTVEIVDEISSAGISASVPCNEVNCPQEEVEVGFFTSIVNWFSDLWTGQN